MAGLMDEPQSFAMTVAGSMYHFLRLPKSNLLSFGLTHCGLFAQEIPGLSPEIDREGARLPQLCSRCRRGEEAGLTGGST